MYSHRSLDYSFCYMLCFACSQLIANEINSSIHQSIIRGVCLVATEENPLDNHQKNKVWYKDDALMSRGKYIMSGARKSLRHNKVWLMLLVLKTIVSCVLLSVMLMLQLHFQRMPMRLRFSIQQRNLNDFSLVHQSPRFLSLYPIQHEEKTLSSELFIVDDSNKCCSSGNSQYNVPTSWFNWTPIIAPCGAHSTNMHFTHNCASDQNQGAHK